MLIDTHCHLDDPQFDNDREAVLDRARESNIEQMINIGYSPERWKSTVELASDFVPVKHALGLHPHHAVEWSAQLRDDLRQLIEETGAIAVGETGLDYFRDRSERERQRLAFTGQIDLASELALPLVVHLRGDIDEDTMALLADRPPVPVVLHSFEGSEGLAEFAMERGYYIGIGGLATRQKDLRLPMLIQRFPVDRLLLETDAPYLAPRSWRDRRNEPAAVALVGAWLADLLGKSVRDTQTIAAENAYRCFPGLARQSKLVSVSDATR